MNIEDSSLLLLMLIFALVITVVLILFDAEKDRLWIKKHKEEEAKKENHDC